MKKQKLVKWFKEHEKEVIKIGYYAIGFGIGCFVSGKISEVRLGLGLYRLNNDGIIKFFNPATGLEVDIVKAVDVIEQMYK